MIQEFIDRRENDNPPYVVVLKNGNSPTTSSVQRHHSLNGKDILIGSDLDCDIVVNGPEVAPRHIMLSLRHDEWHLKDLVDKLNVYVNDSLVGSWTFRRDGEVIRIGDHVHLKFFLGATADSLYAKQAHHRSITDELTGIYLRRYFDHKLAEDIEWCMHRDLPLSVVMFDIDHFKKINDTYGHAAGDMALQEFVRRIHPLLRKDKDTLARCGGEEFGLILPGTSSVQAYRIAERVRKKVAATTFTYQDQEISLTISVGIASTQKPISVLKLVELADAKLYRAKDLGRNRVER